jgi:hypothetical protein
VATALKLHKRFDLFAVLLLILLLLSLVGLMQVLLPAYTEGILWRSRRWMAVAVLGGLLLTGEAALLVASLHPTARGKLSALLDRLVKALQPLKNWNLALFALMVGVFSALMLIDLTGVYFQNQWLRFAVFGLVVLVGAVFWKASGAMTAGGAPDGWAANLAAASLSAAALYYYASLYFSERIYGIATPPTVLHPSRYLMQAVPYLLPGTPIWLHRLWQVILWIGVTLLTSWALARRLPFSTRLQRWGFVTWSFLFLLIGPVYYHLQVVALIILAFFYPSGSPERKNGGISASLWRETKPLLAVLLASAWAGISRINWFPVAAMLAVGLYLLAIPVGGRPLWRYLLRPLVWGLAGGGMAFAAQQAYIGWSGNPAEQFTSSFTSDLFWYRLLPNPTFPLGILPAAVLVSLPLLYLAGHKFAGRWASIHWLRWLGLVAMMVVLFAGGLVVSVKIGGGNNLHNMDAYMTLLLVSASHLFFGKFAVEQTPATSFEQAPDVKAKPALELAALALAILLPVYFAVASGVPLNLPSNAQARQALETLVERIRRAGGENGKVLFLSQRQLLTFKDLERLGLKLEMIPDYERVFMMEMAMAGNPDYLSRFYEDLKTHRFAAIISEPLFLPKKGSREKFGEENDAWVKQVSKHVLCYYEPDKTLKEVGIQILVPRADNEDCP